VRPDVEATEKYADLPTNESSGAETGGESDRHGHIPAAFDYRIHMVELLVKALGAVFRMKQGNTSPNIYHCVRYNSDGVSGLTGCQIMPGYLQGRGDVKLLPFGGGERISALPRLLPETITIPQVGNGPGESMKVLLNSG
jgi:hypothetical protein